MASRVSPLQRAKAAPFHDYMTVQEEWHRGSNQYLSSLPYRRDEGFLLCQKG